MEIALYVAKLITPKIALNQFSGCFINFPDGERLLRLLQNLSLKRSVNNFFCVSVRSIDKRVTNFEEWAAFRFTVEKILQCNYIHIFIRKKFVSRKQN